MTLVDNTNATILFPGHWIDNRFRLLDYNDYSSNPAVWFNTRVAVNNLYVSWNMQWPVLGADGIVFVIQNDPNGLSTHGGPGEYIGYYGIQNSIGVKFDTFQNGGDPSNTCTGIFINGAIPIGGTNLGPYGINLADDETIYKCLATYASGQLNVTITKYDDSATYNATYNVNIESIIGDSVGYVGFTAGSGGFTSTADVFNFEIDHYPTCFLLSSADIYCSSRYSVLTWSSTDGVTIALTDDQGNVLSTAPSGTLTVYPAVDTQYTLSVINAVGEAQSSATVTVDPYLLVPPVDGSASYFNAGASFPIGLYQITQCKGAFSYNGYGANIPGANGYGGLDQPLDTPLDQLQLGNVADYAGNLFGVNFSDRAFSTSQAYKVFDQVNVIDAPGHYVGYLNSDVSSAANYTLVQYLLHDNVGPIGMYLELDNYSKVVDGTPLPAFLISSIPMPEPVLTADPADITAGSSSTLTWSVLFYTGSTVSIDNGIGTVSSSGTQVVSPTITTVYTMTVAIGAFTITTYATVNVAFPVCPNNFTATDGCSSVILSWDPPVSPTTNVLVYKDGALIATLDADATGYTDTSGTGGSYTVKTTDGYNYSKPSIARSAAPITALVVVSGVSMGLNVYKLGPNSTWVINGVPLFTLPALPSNADSYAIFRGTSPGGESDEPIATPLAGVWGDATVVFGQRYYYTVAYKNACGVGPIDTEYSVVPQYSYKTLATTTSI